MRCARANLKRRKPGRGGTFDPPGMHDLGPLLQLGGTCSGRLLKQCAEKLGSCLARHELTHIRRMLCWGSAADACSRIGCLPRRWEVPMSAAWGVGSDDYSVSGDGGLLEFPLSRMGVQPCAARVASLLCLCFPVVGFDIGLVPAGAIHPLSPPARSVPAAFPRAMGAGNCKIVHVLHFGQCRPVPGRLEPSLGDVRRFWQHSRCVPKIRVGLVPGHFSKCRRGAQARSPRTPPGIRASPRPGPWQDFGGDMLLLDTNVTATSATQRSERSLRRVPPSPLSPRVHRSMVGRYLRSARSVWPFASDHLASGMFSSFAFVRYRDP